MFRRRIYAQGFTIFAMLAGSAYWENDRKKRNEYDELIEDKKKKDQHEAWLRELEAREEEEVELRKMRERIVQSKITEKQRGFGEKTSVLEEIEKRGLWGRRRG
nr:respiratory supercomplex factor 1, mitochondrial [Quercus suber]